MNFVRPSCSTRRSVLRLLGGIRSVSGEVGGGGGGGGRGYESIGSFHSGNVEVLANLPDEKYVPPELPFDIDPTCLPPRTGTIAPTPDGGPSFSDDFLIDRGGAEGWAFLNHGAFGGALKCGHLRARQWRDYLELQPLRYFDRDLLPHLAYSNRLVADFINGHKAGTALVQNATGALNAVIAGHARKHPDGKVLYFDVSYGSVKKMCDVYFGADRVREIPFQNVHLPLKRGSDQQHPRTRFFEAYDAAVSSLKRESPTGSTNSLLVLDHTTSNTAINVPIEQLASMAKADGMSVLVDGAHGMLAQDLDMQRLTSFGVDYYVSNAHKWLSAPRGAAVLYCGREDLRETVLRRPAVISHGIDDGFLSRFLWDGCRDYAAQLALPIILDYWNRIGPDRVRELNKKMLREAVVLLGESWHPTLGLKEDNIKESADLGVTLAPFGMHSPMALVRLPEGICGRGEKTSADAKAVQDELYNNKVEVPIKCVGARLWVRVSAHVYNSLDDYLRLAHSLSVD